MECAALDFFCENIHCNVGVLIKAIISVSHSRQCSVLKTCRKCKIIANKLLKIL